MKVNRALNAYIMALLVLCIPLSASAHGKNGTAVEWGFPHKPGIVLVLSGGGTRGLAHIGVFEALERENIPISAIVGTSMGAIMGGLYACGYSPAEMEEILSNANLMEIISDRANAALPDMGFNSPPSWEGDIISFQKTKKGPVRGNLSLLQTKDLYSFLSELTSRTAITDFDELPIPFAAVATDLETGDCVELRDGNLASALRASMSIPGIFAPWEIDNRLLMDGGLKANLPVAVAKRIFPGHPVVAVNLSPQDITRPREHINSIMDVAAQTLEILMVEQTRENAALADVLIAPDVKDFGMLDSTGYDEIIGRGAAAALAQMDKIRMALNKHLAESASLPAHQLCSIKETTLLVADVLFDGVPQNVADSLYNKYDKWIGKPLDMSEVSGAVKELSARKEFVSVEGRTKRLSKDKAAVIFSIKRSPKYHFGMSGYAGNISSARWLSLSAQISDILADGDIGGIEARAGTDWGAMLRYFTPLDSRNSQFGIVLAARRESGKPSGAASYDFERYSARAAWYKQLNGNVRVGLGYAFSQADTGGEQKYHGPYAHLNFNYLDDPLLPTKGFAFLSDIWWPTDADAVTHTRFQTHIPFRKAIPKWTLVLSGGLKTGDMTDPAYAAYLGSCEELYSLADHPAGGDQAMWLHLGLMGILTKTWWGGLNVELFANYGEVYRNWSRLEDFWETGLALTIPTNTIRGKLVLVYDKDEEFTIGYSVGIPVWWNGPIP